MSYKAEVIADSSGKWVGNGLRFATQEETQKYAYDLASRWSLVTDVRVVESTDPVLHVFEDDQVKPIKQEA